MTKYSKEIVLEAEPYRTVRFSVSDCPTKESADKELRTWLKDYPDLVSAGTNKKVIDMVLVK